MALAVAAADLQLGNADADTLARFGDAKQGLPDRHPADAEHAREQATSTPSSTYTRKAR